MCLLINLSALYLSAISREVKKRGLTWYFIVNSGFPPVVPDFSNICHDSFDYSFQLFL